MPRIRQLDRAVINKIAAGEVLERPANAVKELLENSVDALSTLVQVQVVQGGSELIRVVDNGHGMPADDVLLAVAPHATSKIYSADDLFRVRTMGFRGEALASMAEVSQLTIRSRIADAEAGVELQVNFGQTGEPRPCGCPPGTSIEIARLFDNTPVRRKFMKTASTEFGHITEQFTRIALANPRLHMVLHHNQRSVYELPATDRLLERLRLFYGRQLAENLIDVESADEDVRMWGYVAHPCESKANRKGQFVFLNGRYIQDRSLQHALTESYRGLLMVGRHPIAFLFIEMPAALVDVNVHPTKTEVRFQEPQRVYRQLLSMIRSKFLGMDLPSQLRVRSPLASATAETAEPDKQFKLSAWTADPREPFEPHEGSEPHERVEPRERDPVPLNETRERLGTGFPSIAVESAAQPLADLSGRTDHHPTSASPPPAGGESVWDAQDGLATSMAQTGPSPPTPAHSPAPHAPQQRAMQIHDCYLVAETDQGLAVIDQHALHERVLYEYFRERVLSGSVESQRMLVPRTIELTQKEAALLLENAEVLAQLGFRIEEFGHNTVLLSGYPVMLAKAPLEQLIRDIAEQFEMPQRKPTRRDILDELLHMMSCKAAIKAGQRLTAEEIDSLLAKRHLIDDAHHCPHGRPTALVLSQKELDRQFGRLG